MRIFVSLLLSVIINFLFALDVNISKGWTLLGAQSKITDMSIFDKDEIISLYVYDKGVFKSYPNNSLGEISEIDRGEGYWVNASSQVTVSFDDSKALTSGDIYGVNVDKGWRLLGALQDLCVNHIFNHSFIKSVWTYDFNSEWKQYSKENKTELIEIPKGQGYWVNSDITQQLMPYFKISGNIADGYIKDAKLEITSLDTGKTLPIVTNPTTLRSVDSIQSELGGKFTFYINSNSASAYEIKIAGGDDESSGEKFEGTLKAVVPNLGCTSSDFAVRHITPISSIVAKSFSDAKKSTKSLRSSFDIQKSVEQQIASLLGVPQSSLANDPIELLNSDLVADKKIASRLIKIALVIQKTAEIITKSVISDAIDGDIQKGTEVAMDSISASLSQSATDFNNTILDIPTLISNSVSGFGGNSQEKLNALKDVLLSATTLALNMDETKLQSGDAFAQIELTQKALEVITDKIEQKVQDVARATSGFENLAVNAKNVIKAIAMSGGVDGIRALVKSEIDRLVVDDLKLDISDFADKLLDDATINKKSEQFNAVFGELISTDIVNVASRTFKEIIEKKVAGEIVKTQDVSDIIAKNIVNLDANVQQDINNKAIANIDEILSEADNLIESSKSVANEVAGAAWLVEIDDLASWGRAIEYCTSLSARLPTSEELISAYANKTPGFNPVHFYWSSTQSNLNSLFAVRVFFDDGSAVSSKKTDNSFVRCIKF